MRSKILARMMGYLGCILAWIPGAGLPLSAGAREGDWLRVPLQPSAEMDRLLREHDVNHDFKITVDDLKAHSFFASPSFQLRDEKGHEFSVEGIYPLSNLLQELKRGAEKNPRRAVIEGEKIFENPVQRISRLIREEYWDGLTRVLDEKNLGALLADPKVKKPAKRYLYVAHDQLQDLEYFQKIAKKQPALRLEVVRMPREITPQYVKSLQGKHGLLALKPEVPFVVPGGRFNEMYGWDSYFEGLGLLADKKVELARSMVDQLVYQIRSYGKILNANRSYYLSRSQPPFLPSFIRAVREALPDTPETQTWLQYALESAIQEYEQVWMGPDRLTETGLSRYGGNGIGIPPEVEPGHFDSVLKPYAKMRRLTTAQFAAQYDAGKIREPELDAFFKQDQAVRESGHDTTYRWRVDGKDRASDFVTVDLNSLLYKAELEVAAILERYFEGEIQVGQKKVEAKAFRQRAKSRKDKMLALLWDSKRKLFFDYDFVRRRKSEYVSATTLYPLWAWDPQHPETRLLNPTDEKKFVEQALKDLELPGGVAATAAASLLRFGDSRVARQWEHPNGWAPHQMLIWRGLRQSGYETETQRLIYKWLFMITQNATKYHGTIPEKYDVLKRSHLVFAEYGNVGTQFAYITREGFGWMNASYQVGLQMLSTPLRQKLEVQAPPEWVEFQKP